jgi:hypothetical protein
MERPTFDQIRFKSAWKLDLNRNQHYSFGARPISFLSPRACSPFILGWPTGTLYVPDPLCDPLFHSRRHRPVPTAPASPPTASAATSHARIDGPLLSLHLNIRPDPLPIPFSPAATAKRDCREPSRLATHPRKTPHHGESPSPHRPP